MNSDNKISNETQLLNSFVVELVKDFRIKKLDLSFTSPGKMDAYYYEMPDEQKKIQKVLVMHSQLLDSSLIADNVKYTTGAINGKIKQELNEKGFNILPSENLHFVNIHAEEYNLGMTAAVEFTINLVTGLLGAQVEQKFLEISNVFASEETKNKMNSMLGIISRSFGLTSVKYVIKSVSLDQVVQGHAVNLDYFHRATLGADVPVLVSNY